MCVNNQYDLCPLNGFVGLFGSDLKPNHAKYATNWFWCLMKSGCCRDCSVSLVGTGVRLVVPTAVSIFSMDSSLNNRIKYHSGEVFNRIYQFAGLKLLAYLLFFFKLSLFLDFRGICIRIAGCSILILRKPWQSWGKSAIRTLQVHQSVILSWVYTFLGFVFLLVCFWGFWGGSYLIEIIGEITLGRQAYCLSTYRWSVQQIMDKYRE